MKANQCSASQAPRSKVIPDFLQRINKERIADLMTRSTTVKPTDAAGKWLIRQGIAEADFVTLSHSLRYVSDLKYWEPDAKNSYQCTGSYQGLLALFSSCDGDSETLPPLLWRVYLTETGEVAKVNRPHKVTGTFGTSRGLSIRLGEPVLERDGFHLCVAVGLTNALAVRKETGLPVWAVYDDFALASFVFPKSRSIQWLHIYTDNANSNNAAALVRKAQAFGICADVRLIDSFKSL